MAKCKGMNERLGKKNEERKKDNQSLGLAHEARTSAFHKSYSTTSRPECSNARSNPSHHRCHIIVTVRESMCDSQECCYITSTYRSRHTHLP
eukprot:scaffold978_cov122-Skeletonema_dohrnii-CCMP3373.AAC.7